MITISEANNITDSACTVDRMIREAAATKQRQVEIPTEYLPSEVRDALFRAGLSIAPQLSTANALKGGTETVMWGAQEAVPCPPGDYGGQLPSGQLGRMVGSLAGRVR